LNFLVLISVEVRLRARRYMIVHNSRNPVNWMSQFPRFESGLDMSMIKKSGNGNNFIITHDHPLTDI
jgi:hypothetical protein